jgi:hypothetical protein
LPLSLVSFNENIKIAHLQLQPANIFTKGDLESIQRPLSILYRHWLKYDFFNWTLLSFSEQ